MPILWGLAFALTIVASSGVGFLILGYSFWESVVSSWVVRLWPGISIKQRGLLTAAPLSGLSAMLLLVWLFKGDAYGIVFWSVAIGLSCALTWLLAHGGEGLIELHGADLTYRYGLVRTQVPYQRIGGVRRFSSMWAALTPRRFRTTVVLDLNRRFWPFLARRIYLNVPQEDADSFVEELRSRLPTARQNLNPSS